MMKKRMNKKAEENVLQRHISAIIILILFTIGTFTFMTLQANGAVIKEKIAVRQIALLINSMQPGTKIVIDMAKLKDEAMSYDYAGKILEINPEKNQIKIQLGKGKGQIYPYYTRLGADNIQDLNKEIHITS